MSTFVLMAGGTGGHLFPAMALAQELRRRGHVIHLMTAASQLLRQRHGREEMASRAACHQDEDTHSAGTTAALGR